MPPKKPSDPPHPAPAPAPARATTIVDDIGRAIDRLSEAGQLMRTRLDEIDPLAHAARWAGVNDEIRALDDRIATLRAQQQRVALADIELRPLGVPELLALREATATVAELVRAAGRLAAVAEAASRLADAAGAAIQRVVQRR